jgi:hypothetical protein
VFSVASDFIFYALGSPKILVHLKTIFSALRAQIHLFIDSAKVRNFQSDSKLFAVFGVFESISC